MEIKIAAPGTRCIDGSSSEYCVSRRWGCSFHLELGFQNVEYGLKKINNVYGRIWPVSKLLSGLVNC